MWDHLKKRRVWGSCLVGFFLHAVAVSSIWQTWPPGTRSAWLVYMDLPFSLLWSHLPGTRVLWASLVGGGLWWGLVTALLGWWIGRVVASSRTAG